QFDDRLRPHDRTLRLRRGGRGRDQGRARPRTRGREPGPDRRLDVLVRREAGVRRGPAGRGDVRRLPHPPSRACRGADADGAGRAMKRALFRIAAIVVAVAVAAIAVEVLAQAYLLARDRRYISPRVRLETLTNTFTASVTNRSTGCRYIDTLYPHPY